MKKNKIIAILVIIFISIAKTMTAFNADSTKMTNIVIFISFKDSETPAWDRFLWEQWFEDPAVWWNIKGYFNAVSYGKLELNNYFYPTVTDKTDPNTIIYYADTNPIAYYQPLSDSNPIGYTISDRSDREVGLYKRAIDFVQTNTPIDVGIELDGDNDGEVDNVYFICNSESNKPTYSGILWGHQPTLRPYYDLSINGKKVNKVCMGALHASIGGTTHELFHVLGFPELYHYQKYSDTNKYNIAAGYWDPMGEANAIVHPSAYMKYRYGKWIDSIPLISTAGTYTLNKIIEPNNNCYKITSPISEKEYFVLEYRTIDSNTYEYTGLEQTSGLLISRINTAFDGKGNSLYDGETVFDEVYVYRPIGNNTDSAAFSNLNGRTTFNSTTSNPICYLTYGKPGGISISNVVEDTLNNTLSFTFDGYDINIVPSIECADTILVGATTGSNATIDITTNLIDWSVDRKQSWFNVANKYLEDKITLKATMANRTDDRRIGQIDITFKGEVLKTITVVQLGQNESLTNSTPMDLQTFIYPNPVTDVLHISSPNYKISNVKIFDIVGKEILSKDVVNDEIDCSILKPGAYSVELRSSTYITRHKLIKRY